MPLLAWEEYHNVYLGFWALFAFWEAYFHKIKCREILSISHYLNTTDGNAGLTENFSVLTELYMCMQEFQNFAFGLSSLILTTLGQNCVQ
jgi:hypothetical protein